MAIDAGFIIRTSSAALYVLLGLAVLVVGRRKLSAVTLGALLVCFGGYLLLNNFVLTDQVDVTTFQPVVYAGVAATGAFAILVAILMPRPLARREWWAFAAGLVVAGVLLVAVLSETGLSDNEDLAPFWLPLLSLYIFGIPGLLVTLSVRAALDPPKDLHGWIRPLGLLMAFGLFEVFATPRDLGLTSWWALVSTLLLVAAVSVPWLVAAVRSKARFVGLVALVWPMLGILAFLYYIPLAGVDVYGMQGVLRLIGWSVLVYAILRADLLGVALPKVAVSRGTVAAGSLALLFIVAQIAQNFFSAEYGLLTGGIIAGTFLFAASPIQKRIERIGGKPARAASSPDGNDQAFRAAVQFALRDRRLSHEEELSLADLAERLGIGARRATEIRLAVEKERGLR